MSRPARPPLIACPDCDLLQRPPSGAGQEAALRCPRCDTLLRKPPGPPHETLIALATTGLVLLVLANTFPLAALTVQGQQISATLPDAIATLWHDEMRLLAVIVAFTTSIAPGAELLALIYVLAGLRSGTEPAQAPAAMRLLHAIDEWNMTEVFVLAALVALIKLTDYAEVHFGLALWSLGGAMFLMVTTGNAFDARAAWSRWTPRR